ncbi:unnamed protein product [Rotaria sp. Silwood2]|nr:unnamed protein product [Rotaria sp. Silwood2]
MGVQKNKTLDSCDATGDHDQLDAPVKSIEDKWKLVPAFLKIKGLVKQHLDSFDYFVNTEIKKIMLANQEILIESDPSFYMRLLCWVLIQLLLSTKISLQIANFKKQSKQIQWTTISEKKWLHTLVMMQLSIFKNNFIL